MGKCLEVGRKDTSNLLLLTNIIRIPTYTMEVVKAKKARRDALLPGN